MTDEDSNVEAYEGEAVYDASGGRLGVVAAVDAADGVLYVEPDPDVARDAWAAVGDDELVNYDENWFMTPDYEVWKAGEAADDGFEEWPYAVGVEEVSETGDGLRLESTSLTELVEELLPFVGSGSEQ